jgi:hypothetical protein
VRVTRKSRRRTLEDITNLLPQKRSVRTLQRPEMAAGRGICETVAVELRGIPVVTAGK